MAITIERNYNKFKVRVHDQGFGSYRMEANTPEEAALCVIHYYGEARGHLGENPKCPSCRRMKEEAAKEARKASKKAKR